MRIELTLRRAGAEATVLKTAEATRLPSIPGDRVKSGLRSTSVMHCKSFKRKPDFPAEPR
ncbi:hypothetical protein DWB58_28620 [candidate division KSB1 bacterium]|nr:hypothetical protein [candidate division KSB1 bacterium]